MTRRWKVCVNPEMEDVVIDADTIWYSQDTGWLVFSRDSVKGHFAAFAPGKWSYFLEAADAAR